MNRFWLGEELYDKYSEWALNLSEKIRYFGLIFLGSDDSKQSDAADKFTELDEKIRASKEDIARILKQVN